MSRLVNKPMQRLSTSQKTKKWKVDNVNYLCSQADEYFDTARTRMYDNYLMHNNVINQEDYQQYCDLLGLDVGKGKDYIQPFNKTYNKINVLEGEERKRPWRYTVHAINKEVTNEVIRQKERDLRKYLEFQFKKEFQMQQERHSIQMQAESEGLDPKEAEKMIQEAEKKFQQEEQMIMNPAQIKEKYRSFQTSTEKKMHYILKHLQIQQKLRHKKNEGFFDACVAGLEAVRICLVNGEPTAEIVNPLGIAYHKSPEVQFIQDGEYVTYKREMTISDVLDIYGNDLKEKDVRELQDYSGNVYGLDAKMYSKDAFSPSHWEHSNSRPTTGNITNVPYIGKYGQSMASDDYVVVYTCYWKSLRKIGFLTYTDEYGEEQQDIVDELFPIPEEAEKMKFTDPVNYNTKIMYAWTTIEGQQHSLVWEWAPQVWEGTRVHTNYFCNIRPLPHQYQSIENPFKAKLPIFGVVYNNRNAPIMSIMDRMRPWQKLYYLVMHKWLKLISQDRSVIHMINALMVDPDIGPELTMQYVMDTAIQIYNPLANAEVSGLVNSQKPADAINLSNSQQLAYYTELLRFIDEQIGESSGVTKEREGRTQRGTNVTDNQQDIIQSSHITEQVFALHDLLWEDVLNGLVRLAQQKYSDGKSHLVRYILSDEEIANLEIEANEFDTLDFGITVKDSSQSHEALNILKQNAHAILQQDKKSLSKLTKLLASEDLNEFKDYVEEIEANIEQQEQQAQQAQQEHEKKLAEKEIEHREDQQQHEIETQDREIEKDILIKEMEIEANRENATMNSDTSLEEMKEIIKERVEQRKLDMQNEQANRKLNQDEDIADRKITSDERIANKKLDSDEKLGREQIKSKERIEKAKPKPKPSK
jgi:hypothetical protein